MLTAHLPCAAFNLPSDLCSLDCSALLRSSREVSSAVMHGRSDAPAVRVPHHAPLRQRQHVRGLAEAPETWKEAALEHGAEPRDGARERTGVGIREKHARGDQLDAPLAKCRHGHAEVLGRAAMLRGERDYLHSSTDDGSAAARTAPSKSSFASCTDASRRAIAMMVSGFEGSGANTPVEPRDAWLESACIGKLKSRAIYTLSRGVP